MKRLTRADFVEQYVKPAMESLFDRWMAGTLDPLDREILGGILSSDEWARLTSRQPVAPVEKH